MELSLIISTRDNADRLRSTLDDLARCHVESPLRWEVVLVNHASTDETDSVAASFARRLPLRYLHESRPGVSRSRNTALAHACGELVVFTDDDVALPRGWLMCYWHAYRKWGRRCFFGGSVFSRYEAEPPSAALQRIAPPSVAGLDLGARPRVLERGEGFIGANWAAPAAALAQVGGFDPRLGLNADPERVMVGEESDLMRRLREAGWQPRHLPEASVTHHVPAHKCTREHIVARRVAQFREEAVQRYARPALPWMGAARALTCAAMLWGRARVAPLIGRTGLLSRTQSRACLEAASIIARQRSTQSRDRSASA